VILATFAEVDAEDAKAWKPTVVFVDDKNRMVAEGAEIAGPKRRLTA
jgi:aspartate 1-decarboxylase